jgi:hypothetical protein
MSLSTLLADRATAGARYAAAVAELKAAAIDLAAYDRALFNARWGRAHSPAAGAFPDSLGPDRLPRELVHVEFAPEDNGWRETIRATADGYLATY